VATALAAADVTSVLLASRAPAPILARRSSTTASARPAPLTHRDGASLLGTITTRNLFKAAATSGAVPVSPLSARYELTGTVVSKDATASFAIVRERTPSGDGASRTLHVGDSFDARTRVESIEAPRVVLAGASGREQLSFGLDEDTAAVGPAAAAEEVAALPEIERAADGSVTIGSSTFDRYLSDPSPLFSQARIAGSMTDGRNEGFRFSAVQRGSIFERLGLQSGDVVQKIDGQELSSLEVALNEIQNLRSKHDFQAMVRRGERTETLAFHVR